MRRTEPEADRSHADPPFDIVAIASSAGGVFALGDVLRRLPPDFDAIIVCVQHLDPRHQSLLPEVLGRRSVPPVCHATDGTRLERSNVYLGPPDHHMLVNRGGTITLTKTELVNFVRPSADLLFESVAAAYGSRAVAVVLTGAGKDGAIGVTAIKQRGGTVIAQDEASSEFYGMPSSAIRTGTVDFVLSLEEIPGALVTLFARKEEGAG